MNEFAFYLMSFALVYIIYFFLVLMNEKTLKKYEHSAEVSYLKGKYGMKINAKNIGKIAVQLAILNSLVVANTVLIVILLSDNYIVMMLLGFVIVIPMILIMYHLFGTYYKSEKIVNKPKTIVNEIKKPVNKAKTIVNEIKKPVSKPKKVAKKAKITKKSVSK